MRLFSRYVFRQAAGALVLILLSLTTVVWIAVALKQLNLVTNQGQEAWLFFKMTLLALPSLMALIAPVALLIAAIHTLNRLNGDSELIVISAAGATTWTYSRPLILLGLITCAGLSFVNHIAQPWSLRLLRDHVIQVRTDLISQVLQPGRFSSPEERVTFHMRARGPREELLGILMHDTRDQKQSISYLAEQGVIQKQDDGAYLVMTTGHIVRRTLDGKPPQIIAFDRYIIDLARFERKGAPDELKPRERYFAELLNPNPRDVASKTGLGHIRAELHERFASALYPLAFVFIAVAFVGQAQTTRQNRVQMVVIAFLLAIACRLGGLAANNLLVRRPSAVILVYAIPIGAMLLAGLYATYRMRPRRRLIRPRAQTGERASERSVPPALLDPASGARPA